MKSNLLNIFLCLAIACGLWSCLDDFRYENYVIGEGEAVIEASVDFHPLVSSNPLGGSRSDGDALAKVSDLTVFIYDSEEKIYDIVNSDELENLNIVEKDAAEGGYNTDMPNDAGGKPVQAEQTTSRATFTLKGIPFGRYYIYCIANMGRFDDNEENRRKFERPAALRQLQASWDEDNVRKNAQMFGYFTPDGNDTNTSAGFQAPQLIINQTRVNLHAWIKRAASKVTLVFDGSGLNQDIWIYVKSVTIKDIPRYCKMGDLNRLTSESPDSMVVNGETIFYDQKGVLAPGESQGPNSTDWLEISRGSGKKGAVTVNEKGDTTLHSEYDAAMYFYENMQGDYKDSPNKEYYNKKQDWNNVGWVPGPGQYDYKDNVKYGSYIEVEAFYISNNPNQVTQGEIKYRFMLGQNETYNYNAERNHHYKITLGFKGYANQPDWHIVYEQQDKQVYNDPTYYVSYKYNTKSVFPIRMIGEVDSVDVEIIENNWAPYDPGQSDSVPPAEVGTGAMDFKWYRDAYLTGVAPAPANNDEYNGGRYNYGLQSPRTRDGKNPTSYDNELAPKKVTPIWAGFLALQVPGNTIDDLPEAELHIKDGYTYNTVNDRIAFKNNYYNRHQNYRTIPKSDLKFTGWTPGNVITNYSGEGNNRCEVVKAADGSVTVKLPMWTRPKILLGISGFSGNNPYDTYQRKGMVRIRVYFKGDKTPVERYVVVKQVRRVVNPKAVWRRWNDNTSFHVSLVRREGASAQTFSSFKSEGAWRAKVKTWSDGSEGFITLDGGIGKDAEGAIVGNTGDPIDFDIKFNGKGESKKSHCAIIEIEYHGFTCSHTIFVRQGYYEPLAINGPARWSSFSLFRCHGEVTGKLDSTAYLTTWDANKKNYIKAELTASPLALGTLFRRANYDGFLVENNAQQGLGPRQSPGQTTEFMMSNGKNKCWSNVKGLVFVYGYGLKYEEYGANDIHRTWSWGRFETTVDNETRHYRVPTYKEYEELLKGEFGVGVLYGSGATTTATKVSDAYEFEDYDNNGYDNFDGSTRGMRGIIVYNPQNAHQLFFPVGARGIGRRTITGFTGTSYNDFGVLRYGGTASPLTGAQNSLRPIPYNLPASPGAIYWLNQADGPDGSKNYLSWDMNYFDMNFNAYDFATSFHPGGDALPIKVVLDE